MGFLDNIGTVEWVIIGLVFLLLFGNKKVSEMAKGLGEGTKELKKAKKEWTETLSDTSLKIGNVTDEIKTSIKESLDLKETPKPTVTHETEKEVKDS